VNLIRNIWYRLNSDDCTDVAAQVSFYFVRSLFPFLLVLASLLGWIPTTSRWDAFADWITTYFPFQARRLVLINMIELSYGYGGFLSFGLLATIWSASSGFLSLREALSTAYGLKDGRSYLKKRAIAFCATLVAALFVLLSFALWNLGHLIVGLISHDFVVFEMQWRFARWVATFLLMCIGIDLINYFLPAVEVAYTGDGFGCSCLSRGDDRIQFLHHSWNQHTQNLRHARGLHCAHAMDIRRELDPSDQGGNRHHDPRTQIERG
jgi:membrane protein